MSMPGPLQHLRLEPGIELRPSPGNAPRGGQPAEIAVIIPFFNEEENIGPLIAQLTDVLTGLGKAYEIVVVDDGSADSTVERARAIAARDPAVKVVQLLRNYGQTAAMMAGIDFASGDILVAMDGDGQNDPADIPRLLEKLEEGYDVVSGWRQDRKDSLRPGLGQPHRQPADFLRLGRAAARLWLLAKGLPPRRDQERPALRRDAPLHPDLHQVAGRQDQRDPGGAPSRARGASPNTGSSGSRRCSWTWWWCAFLTAT